MENASKALIMAGTMLIGILLVALMVYFFSSAAGVRSSYSQSVNETRMAEFNTDFTKYAVTKNEYIDSNGKTYVTIHDIVTLANNADEFNKELDEEDFDYITIEFSNVQSDRYGTSPKTITVTGIDGDKINDMLKADRRSKICYKRKWNYL